MTKYPSSEDYRSIIIWLFLILQAITTAFVGWTFTSVQDMRERIVRLETKMDVNQVASTSHTRGPVVPN